MARQVYAIVGHPVRQVRSPQIFNARFVAEGVDAVMVALDVMPSNFAGVLAGLRACENIAGIIVTVPHKLQAAALAAKASPRVMALGAANVLRPHRGGWEADLLDGLGFAAGLLGQGHTIAGRAAAVVGAGGAGLAIAEALLANGATVSLSDIDAARGHNAVERLRALHGAAVRLGSPGKEHSLAVNATPVGMGGGSRLPFDPAVLSANAVVAEAIMKPASTPLLDAAAGLGLRTVEGRHMLDGQVQPMWDFFAMGKGRTEQGAP
jgi:shikimate dehydrogenase